MKQKGILMNTQRIISAISALVALIMVVYVNEKEMATAINITDIYLFFIFVMSFLTLIGFKKMPDNNHIKKFIDSVTCLEFIPRIGIFTYFIYIWNIPMFIITLAHFFILWKLFEDFVWSDKIDENILEENK
jgi:hypothetical protein